MNWQVSKRRATNVWRLTSKQIARVGDSEFHTPTHRAHHDNDPETTQYHYITHVWRVSALTGVANRLMHAAPSPSATEPNGNWLTRSLRVRGYQITEGRPRREREGERGRRLV